ncbi:peptidoglycan-recognition protein LA-like isoform X1 [Anopheles bellator]|uniref:peptidoglycan-recognition protein LA-like isoform X1 n=1 Tax=Anopheles bellator TaxID=139047 RepID=UPI002647C5FB|nr:peptidoglycan-recognition protein LA-like isoform X1 [Anopheles bellator]
MKLLLKIHNKERNQSSPVSTAANLFQRKRKYYHRRTSKSSSSLVPVSQTGTPATHSAPSSSFPSAPVTSSAGVPSSRAVSSETNESSSIGIASSSTIYGGNYTTSVQCSTDRWPLLQRNIQSSSCSFASNSRSGRNNQNRSLPSTVPSTLRQERYFIYGALIFFAIIGFSSAIYVIINQTRTANDLTPSQDINFDRNYDSRTIPTLGNSHMIIDRRNWGSQDDVSASVQLKRPISYVIVTHIGVSSKACTDVYQCSNKLRILQDAAIGERHLPDLPSNFYIGGDGNVYVGRGWRIANSYHNRTLSVCFMGDYNRYDVNDSQISALQHLLTYGVVQNSLATDYKLVGRQQTKNTTSPGSLLYAKIVRLSRWDPCGTQGYSHCGAELGYPAVWDEERLLNKRNGITIHMVGTRKTTEEE